MSANKVCMIVSDCQKCAGLCEADIQKLAGALKSAHTAHVAVVKAPCIKETRKELRELHIEGCDRAVVGIWCSPEKFASVNWLPKKIAPSLTEVVDLSVHMDKKAACASQIDKLARIMRSSAAGLAHAELLKDRDMPFVSKSVAVIGSNERAVETAKSLSSKGLHTKLISVEPMPEIKTHNVEVIDSSTTEALSGIPGNFKISYSRKGQKMTADAAAIVLVSERRLSKAAPPKDSKVKLVPLEQFKNFSSNGIKVKGMVFLDDLLTLTAVSDPVVPAWHTLLESAKTAAANHLADSVVVLARDVKAAGLLELAWKEAAEAGVKFVRYDDKSRPKINKDENSISVKDLVLGESLDLPTDVIVAPITTRPWEPIFIERLYIPADWDLKTRLRGPQRGTAQSTCDGIFLVGYAGFNKLLDVAEPELDSAVAQTLAFMRKGSHLAKGAVAIIDEGKCSACLTCVRTCPYRAAIMNANWKAEIVADKCAGCGNCVAVCPSIAIELKNCTRPQVSARVSTSLEVAQ
jgi:heterodisulfide reductase subunit A-like polyferredoxin